MTPKQTAGITKFQRISAIKSVLKRWGRLKKNQIDEYVAAALGCPVESIERALYRDLEDLEAMREITVYRFTRDGRPAETNDDLELRSTYCEWALAETEKMVLGAGILKESGANLLAAPRIASSFTVKLLSDKLNATEINLCFFTGPNPICLSLATEAYPVRILVGRTLDPKTGEEFFQKAQEKFGARCACLTVPVPNISKFKDAQQLGHLMVDFKEADSVTLLDLNSKNGTSFKELSSEEFKKLLSKMKLSKEATSTDKLSLQYEGESVEALASGQSVKLRTPCLIRASKAFELLIFHN